MPRFGNSFDQVRDGTYAEHTPSLETQGNEPVPDEIVRDLLIEQWLETVAAPRPLIIVKNDIKQADMRKTDVIVVSIDKYGAEFIGHRHEHLNIEIPVSIELHTTRSRQRMWNMFAEVRRIILKFLLALRPYQSIYFDGFRPDYEAKAGYHTGVVSIRLTADMLPWATMVVEGMESQNLDPNADPGG